VTLTARVTDPVGAPFWRVWLVLRTPPEAMPARPPQEAGWSNPLSGQPFDSGRVVAHLRLARGCNAVVLASLATGAIEWHFWVQRRDSLDLGTLVLPNPPPITPATRAYLDCGRRDTLRVATPFGTVDTIRVRQPAS
jgi:hypothetical protein